MKDGKNGMPGKRHQRKATRMMVISPMADKMAEVVAENQGIHIYTHAEDVKGYRETGHGFRSVV